MSFNIVFQTSNSDKRALDKNITDNFTVSGVLKKETSIINPVIVIEKSLSDVAGCNYMTINAFGGRKYFITNIKSITNDLVEVSGHVDVLSTYAAGIKKNTGIVYRQEGRGNWNLYLDDGSFKAYQNPKIAVKKFPSGFTSERFVLAVAGSAGSS